MRLREVSLRRTYAEKGADPVFWNSFRDDVTSFCLISGLPVEAEQCVTATVCLITVLMYHSSDVMYCDV